MGLGRLTRIRLVCDMRERSVAFNKFGRHYRVRFDHVDRFGKATLRRAGKMHHLGIGIEHRGES
jgi:hypothetical protein